MVKFFKKQKFEADTGFGASATAQGSRLLKRNGNYNVKRKGIPFSSTVNIYHALINMPWYKFVLLIFGSYTFLNLCFAFIFLAVGMDQIEGDRGLTDLEHFWDAFFFSSQTLTTVGYGRTNPIGFYANLVAAAECLIGLMSFAIITGLLYGRFSRPRVKLSHSESALIAPYKDGMNALMFRVANSKNNPLIECEAQVMLSFIETETNIRRFIFLELEIKKVSSLALSWTIVHPITNESPLYNMREKDLADIDAEFIFLFKAFDETYSQTVHTRFSYTNRELIWGAKFVPMFHRSDNGEQTILQIDKIGAYSKVALHEPQQHQAGE